jgi:alpha-L-rhamnosidase
MPPADPLRDPPLAGRFLIQGCGSLCIGPDRFAAVLLVVKFYFKPEAAPLNISAMKTGMGTYIRISTVARRVALAAALMLGATSLVAAEAVSAVQRVNVERVQPEMNGNIYRLYEIEKAAWIWHPAAAVGAQAIVLFRNQFSVDKETETTIHVSADQRYELSLDGRRISLGPDRGDLMHWSFASYRLKLAPGAHTLEALAAWIGDHAPCAQITHRGGFIFAAEGPLSASLNTGDKSGWKAALVDGWSFTPGPPPNFTGAQQTQRGKTLNVSQAWVVPAVVMPPLDSNEYGLMRAGWRLMPSPLPEQKLTVLNAGAVRAIIPGGLSDAKPVTAQHLALAAAPVAAPWSALLTQGKGSVTIPASNTVTVLVDLGNYFVAYPQFKMAFGKDAQVTLAWAESLYLLDAQGKPTSNKGNRNDIEGKIFHGVEDTFLPQGASAEAAEFRTWWWRAGRYLRLTVHTESEPLRLDGFSLLECRYPLEDEGKFTCSNDGINSTLPLLVRGLQMCSHETYMDCPYYEQLMYVGDTRLEMLTTYLMTRDDRLPKRGIELFDWSRAIWGQVAEHYPSRTPQQSPTFSLIWVSMVRDYAFWRGDARFVRQCLPGMRGVLELFRNLRGGSGLIEHLPGWPFVDWVPAWATGNAPDGVQGISCINNLFFVQALRQAAEVEEGVGDLAMAARNRQLARELSDALVKRFWDAQRGLLADDAKHTSFSEHAQCLALLNGVLAKDQEAACFKALIETKDLHRATVYFSFYLFETFKKFDRGDLIVDRFGFWQDLLKGGFKTPVESPEPSRSDCHAWGSHPLFHMRASLFGLRPMNLGFTELEIAPSPGGLEWLEVKAPHPQGWIEGKLHFDRQSGKCAGEITLPEGVTGTFRWQGAQIKLLPGVKTSIQ